MKRLLLAVITLAFLLAGTQFRLAAQDANTQPCPTDQTTILFGTTVSLTGEFSHEGEDTLQGYQLWVDWVNNEYGGLEVGDIKHCVGLTYYDDESKPAKAAELTRKLITQDKVNFLLGPYSSEVAAKASEVSEAAKVLMVVGNSSAETLFNRHFQYLFGISTPASFYSQSALELAAQLGAQSVVIAYEDTLFPRTVANGAQQWAARAGLHVLDVESYPVGATNLNDIFTRFKNLSPDVFIGGGHFNDAIQFVKTAKAIGFNPKAFIMTVGPTDPEFVKELGKDANFVWGATQWEPSMKWEDTYLGDAVRYLKRYKEKYDKVANYQNVGATAAALVLQLAIERAGSLDTARVREALLTMDLTTFYGPIKFDASGQNIAKRMGAIQIQNGKIVPIAPAKIAQGKPIYPAPAWDQR